MFGIGFGEFLLLGIIIFVLIGPKQLPEVLKVVGNLMRELSKARRELTETIDQDDSLRSIRESVKEVKSTVQDQVQKITTNIRTELTKEEVEKKKSAEEEIKSHE